MSKRNNLAELFLFKIGLSRLISKLSLISRSNLLFPFVKIVNSSKDGMLLQFKRWSRIALSFDGLVFLNVKSDIPVWSPDLTFGSADWLFKMPLTWCSSGSSYWQKLCRLSGRLEKDRVLFWRKKVISDIIFELRVILDLVLYRYCP